MCLDNSRTKVKNSMDLDNLSYGTFIDGKYIEVEPVDKCMKMLQYRFDGKNRTINNL